MSTTRIILCFAFTGILLLGLHVSVRAQSQPEMNATADASATKADQELTVTYQKLRALYKDDAQTLAELDAAEQAWLAYRDKEAEFEASPDSGGSIYPMAVSTITQRLTEERIKYLNVMIKNGGPDAP